MWLHENSHQNLVVSRTLLVLSDCHLPDSTHSLEYNNTISSCSKVNYGVPQGSILGPLLFCVYMFDHILKKYNINYNFYADDT